MNLRFLFLNISRLISATLQLCLDSGSRAVSYGFRLSFRIGRSQTDQLRTRPTDRDLFHCRTRLLLHFSTCIIVCSVEGGVLPRGGGRRDVTRSGGEPRSSDRGQRVAETPSSKSPFRMATSLSLALAISAATGAVIAPTYPKFAPSHQKQDISSLKRLH